jgi:hypothetical protein
VSATGVRGSPTLIYRGTNGDLLDTWVSDFISGNQAYFGSSENGWSSDAFGKYWLKRVFDKKTRKRARNHPRLLVVAGHSSHVNMEFIKICDELGIIFLILPPHSTHRLQPLDLGLFLPLARKYTSALTTHMFVTVRLSSISKRSFWMLFKPSWDASFTKENILSAWAKAGLWPFKPRVVLDVIERPATIEVVI